VRVIGIDPGAVTVDLCGLDDGRIFLDWALPTGEALANPDVVLACLDAVALAIAGAPDTLEALGLREARGTALDYLYVISPAAARARLGIS
jgi:predicted butyrate kinase (DUF1464 family)